MQEKMRLGDIATYVNGYPFKPEDRGTEGLPIIRIQDLTGNSYDLGFYNGEYPSRIEINNGDVLISWSGSLGVYIWDRGKALLNQHIFKVVFDKTEVDKQYYVFAVQHKLQEMESKTHGATMKHIVKSDFDNTVIPFPSCQEQHEISKKLKLIQCIIHARQQQLKSFDTLIKARFVEMFGDPVQNNMNWSQTSMKTVCSKITDGEHGSVPRTIKGHPFLNAKHIKQDGTIDWNSITYISEETHEKIYKRCNPEPDDILMTTTGTIGNVAIVPYVEPFSMDRGITLLKTDRQLVSSAFIAWQLRFDAMQMIMNSNVHASAIGHLFLNKVEQLPVIIPPIELQDQFASFVSQIDKSKAVVQQALAKDQLLFDSLMQQYFG